MELQAYGGTEGSPGTDALTNLGPFHQSMTSLYAFGLPHEILNGLIERGQDYDEPVGEASKAGGSERSGQGCQACAVNAFVSVQEQRAHFGSDWHHYNARRSVRQQAGVSESEWESLAHNIAESISGSESSLSDDSEPQTVSSHKSPLIWYEQTSAPTPGKTLLGFYRSILPIPDYASVLSANWIQHLHNSQIKPDQSAITHKLRTRTNPSASDADPTWAMMMLGGGHFAAMIVKLVPRHLNKSGRIERDLVITHSKTFHRYTTRRKQGGAQSLNDNAKGNAKSAGAQIRRYNEAMLVDEIRQLMDDWREAIADCSLVFMRVGKSSQNIFYAQKDAVLQKGDARIRKYPFPTRRATLAELQRCFHELTSVKVSKFTMEDLQRQEEEARLAAQRKAADTAAKEQAAAAKALAAEQSAVTTVKLSKEEVVHRDRWERFLDMVKGGKLEAARAFVDRQPNKQEWICELPEWVDTAYATPTVLHFASLNGQATIVEWLLVEERVDPTWTGASESATRKTAYEVASTKAVRNVFRRAYAEHPDWWDWEKDARVPSALTEEQESAQKEKGKERKNKLKEKLRERHIEKQQQREEEEAAEKVREEEELRRQMEKAKLEAEKRAGGPRRLGGETVRPNVDNLSGLSEAARMRIERERRARAAELRASKSRE